MPAPPRQPDRIGLERPEPLDQLGQVRAAAADGQPGRAGATERLARPPPLIRPGLRVGPPPGQGRAEPRMQGVHDRGALLPGQFVQPPRRRLLLIQVLPADLTSPALGPGCQEHPGGPAQLAAQAIHPAAGRSPPAHVPQPVQPGRRLLRAQHRDQPPASGTRRKNSTAAPSVTSTSPWISRSPTKTLNIPSSNASRAASTATLTSTGAAAPRPPIRTAPWSRSARSARSVSTRT